MNTHSKAHVLHQLEITADQAGQRIDNFLITHLKGVPRSHIYRVLRRGEVRINKGRIGPEYRLQVGDMIRIPPLRTGLAEATTQPGTNVLAMIQGCIIHEDQGLMVLNKPAGLAVHGGSGLRFGVIEALRALRPDAPCLELVHRLDRDTSGLLMVAKRRSVLRRLHALLRTEGVEKRYLTLVRGIWQGGTRNIDAPLLKNHLESGERVVRVDPTGKAAITRFIPLARNVQPSVSLMEAHPITGRTHQIRVHASYAGSPIAGDEKYGDAHFNRLARNWGLQRLFLHAYHLTAKDNGEILSFYAPLDARLRAVITNVGLILPKELA